MAGVHQVSALDKLLKTEKASLVSQFIQEFTFADDHNGGAPTRVTVSSGVKGFSGVRPPPSSLSLSQVILLFLSL